MSRMGDLVDQLASAVDDEAPRRVRRAADAIRGRLSDELTGRRLEPGDSLLADKRRVHHRLEVLVDKAKAGHFEAAGEDVDVVAPLARELDASIRDRASTPRMRQAPGPDGLWVAWALAGREVRQRLASPRGLVVAVLFLAAFGLALPELGFAPASREVLLWERAVDLVRPLAPIAGIVIGWDLVGRDVRARRLSPAGAGLFSRWGLVAAKAAGGVLALAALVVAPVGLAMAFGLLLDVPLGGFRAATGFTLATVLLGTSFLGLSLVVDAFVDEAATAIAASLGLYVLLGPLLGYAVRASSPQTSLATTVWTLTPLGAWESWIGSLLDASASGIAGPGDLLLGGVLAGWTLASVLIASARIQRDGFR